MKEKNINKQLFEKSQKSISIEDDLYASNVKILPLASVLILLVNAYWFLMDLLSSTYSLNHLSKIGVVVQMAVAFFMLFLKPFLRVCVKSDKMKRMYIRISFHLFYFSILMGIFFLTYSRNMELIASGADVSNAGVSIIVFYVFLMVFMPFPKFIDAVVTMIGIAISLLIPPLLCKGMFYMVMADSVLVACYILSVICYRKIMIEKVLKENQIIDLSGQLMSSSLMDPLTHALNRQAMDDYINRLLADPNVNQLGVCFFDIDFFKQYNDHYGHVAGDDVLKTIVQTIKRQIESKNDRHLYRYGGEEFVVLMSNPTEESLIQQMRDIRTSVLDANLERDDIPDSHCVTVTVGGSIEPLPNQRGDYITNADNQLYLGKKNSRNCIYYKYINYDLDAKNVTFVFAKERVVTEFYQALKEKEFLVFVQPKYGTRTKEIVGGEALVRWKHKEDGYVSPGLFVPALEESKQIVQLDLYIFEELCQNVRKALDHHLHPFPISVNMSRVTLFTPGIVENYLNIIKKYEISPELVPIELTESYSPDGTNIKETLTALKNAGFCVHFDDFGAGYSSLSNLYMLPFDTVKLDKSLIDGIGNEGSEELLRHIIELAHFLKHDVTAEGVETNEQFLFLKKLNCDSIQGYFFNKPMIYEQYETLAEESYQKVSASGDKEQDDTTGEIGSLRVTIDNKLHYLSALAGIYMTMHVIDLIQDTVVEFATTTNVKENANKPTCATAQMVAVMKTVTSPEYLDAMLEFTDLHTVADRMVGKRSISKDFKGTHFGQTRAQFVAVNIDQNGKPTEVIFTTQVIVASTDENHETQVCITDELTGVYNRMAMETEIDKITSGEVDAVKPGLSVLIADINGLHKANLEYGRNAGDELLCAAAECLNQVYGKIGKVFRVHDDVFTVFYYASKTDVDPLQEKMHEMIKNWMGDNIRSFSLSYGNASVWEFSAKDPESLMKEAQKRMLNYKLRYYKS